MQAATHSQPTNQRSRSSPAAAWSRMATGAASTQNLRIQQLPTEAMRTSTLATEQPPAAMHRALQLSLTRSQRTCDHRHRSPAMASSRSTRGTPARSSSRTGSSKTGDTTGRQRDWGQQCAPEAASGPCTVEESFQHVLTMHASHTDVCPDQRMSQEDVRLLKFAQPGGQL